MLGPVGCILHHAVTVHICHGDSTATSYLWTAPQPMLPWLKWYATITGGHHANDTLGHTRTIISWGILGPLAHHISLAAVRDPGFPRPKGGPCMSG